MKSCTKCLKNKAEEEFAWRKKGVSRSSLCRQCQNDLSKAHYLANKDYYKTKAKSNKKNYVPRGKAFVIEYLRTHRCVDCDESDIEVLEFDHVDELLNCKAPRVTSLLAQSIARIKEEISKCEVRCSNCHTRRTRRRAGTLRIPE